PDTSDAAFWQADPSVANGIFYNGGHVGVGTGADATHALAVSGGLTVDDGAEIGGFSSFSGNVGINAQPLTALSLNVGNVTQLHQLNVSTIKGATQGTINIGDASDNPSDFVNVSGISTFSGHVAINTPFLTA